jgi:halocyanin-like protein
MTSFDMERRRLLEAGGAALMAGLAGCTGILADGTGVPGKAEPVEEPGNGNGDGGVPSEVDSALNEQSANGYEGELTDMTGQSEVVIEVGAGDGLAFTGPAVQIDAGTTVIFEWTGQGGNHNVIHDADEPAFDSREAHEGSSIGEEGFQYEVTIEEEGNYVYFCDPHKGLGMWGALVVGGSGGGGGGGGVPSAVDSYLSENSANGYDGSATDMTGQSSVTISVGAGEGLAFDPAAVVVDAGTEITWEWTGNGGGHNVNVNEGPTTFTSETVSEGGHTFSQEVEAGNYLYQCDPHSTLGMHGAVIVQE